jgi:hypothetical protein
VNTRPGICRRKRSYVSEELALRVAEAATVTRRPYRCGLCREWHLTSRTKGMKLPAFEVARRRAAKAT